MTTAAPVVAPALPLRERQREQTHALIRRTAYRLALERGVATVSVGDISRAAGVSPRTFFNHFRSKDEALIPDLPDFDPGARRAFLAAVDEPLIDGLEAVLAGHTARTRDCAGVGEGPSAMQRLVETNPELLPRALAVFQAAETRIAALVAERTGRATGDLFCAVAAAAAMAAVRVAVTTCNGAADPADRADRSGPPPIAIAMAFAQLRAVVAARR